MRNNRIFSLIVAIGAMALAITLTINAGGAAPQVVASDKALLLNQHDPRFSAASDAGTAFALELARISRGATALAASAPDYAARLMSSHKSQNSTGNALDGQTRQAIQIRWLAQHGGTNRTCVLLCGGR